MNKIFAITITLSSICLSSNDVVDYKPNLQPTMIPSSGGLLVLRDDYDELIKTLEEVWERLNSIPEIIKNTKNNIFETIAYLYTKDSKMVKAPLPDNIYRKAQKNTENSDSGGESSQQGDTQQDSSSSSSQSSSDENSQGNNTQESANKAPKPKLITELSDDERALIPKPSTEMPRNKFCTPWPPVSTNQPQRSATSSQSRTSSSSYQNVAGQIRQREEDDNSENSSETGLVEYQPRTPIPPVSTLIPPGRIGSGRNGEIYLVKHCNNLDDWFVIKVIKSRTDYTQPNELRQKSEQILNEAKILQHLKNASNFIPSYRGHEINTNLHGEIQVRIAMSYIQGDSLSALIRGDSFRDDWTKFLITRILMTLQEIHSSGVAHLDLKPENIIFDLEICEIFVVDFGESRFLNTENPRLPIQDMSPGTPLFRSNQFYAAGDGVKADIYAVGVMCAYMLCPMTERVSQERLINASRETSAASFIHACLSGTEIDDLLKHEWLLPGPISRNTLIK